jgi:hypothetical protein
LIIRSLVPVFLTVMTFSVDDAPSTTVPRFADAGVAEIFGTGVDAAPDREALKTFKHNPRKNIFLNFIINSPVSLIVK